MRCSACDRAYIYNVQVVCDEVYEAWHRAYIYNVQVVCDEVYEAWHVMK